jgi:hypothetical protein
MHLKKWRYQRNHSKPLYKEEGRAETTKKDNALGKQPRKEKTKAPRKNKKVIQHVVKRHQKNANDP